MLKTLRSMEEILRMAKFNSFTSPVPPVSLLDVSAGVIARELW
jgi:hypothetical protein